MKVINPRNHKEWDVKTFFSHDGMYGSYTEINDLMLKDGHVSLETVSQIPEILPSTGIHVFDDRREKPGKLNLTDICLSIKNILVTSSTTIVCGLLSKNCETICNRSFLRTKKVGIIIDLLLYSPFSIFIKSMLKIYEILQFYHLIFF